MPAYYVTSAQCCLLSPQNYHQNINSDNGQGEEYFVIHVKEFALVMPDGRTATIIYNKQTNFPTISMQTSTMSCSAQEPLDITGLNACVLSARNQNLTAGQKELLYWHFSLCHQGFDSLQ